MSFTYSFVQTKRGCDQSKLPQQTLIWSYGSDGEFHTSMYKNLVHNKEMTQFAMFVDYDWSCEKLDFCYIVLKKKDGGNN